MSDEQRPADLDSGDRPACEAPDTTSASGAPKADADKPRRSLKRRVFRKLLFLLYLLILLEIGSRAYWAIKRDISFFAGQAGWYHTFYPELRDSGVREADLRPGDGHFDVLLLGGSAIDRFGHFHTDKIRRELGQLTGQPVRVWNLGRPAASTRDSLFKYDKMVSDKHFDLVVVYHGINEIRMNSCPPEMFRDDYTHSGWYAKLEAMESKKAWLPYFTLPYTVQYTWINIGQSDDVGAYLPRRQPTEQWQAYGSDVKTVKPFHDNLAELIRLTGERNQPLVLATFAWYVPEDYTLEAFRERKLDYAPDPADDPSATELWGTVPNVKKGLAEHNRVIRELAEDRPGHVVFADASDRIPDEGAHFYDVCHLSEAGMDALLEAIVQALAGQQDAWRKGKQ